MAVYRRDHAPQQVVELTAALLPRLLDGSSQQLAALRQQADAATVESVESDGLGFFVTLAVPDSLPTVQPLSLTGGEAEIWLVGHEYPMGVVLFVRQGRLSELDFYSPAGTPWAEDEVVDRVGTVAPLWIPSD